MQVTIDIPEQDYEALADQARRRKVSVEALISARLSRPSSQLPTIGKRSDSPLSLIAKHITNFNDAAFWSDADVEELQREAEMMEATERAKLQNKQSRNAA